MIMDFKSLSHFMQTSLAYECTVCKLYFGTENQLLAHHKFSHSKRLKVSLNPQLNLKEDEDYITNSQDESSLISANSSRNDDGNNQEGLNEEHGVAKLENNEAATGASSNSTADSNDRSADVRSQNEHESLDSNKNSTKRTVSECTEEDGNGVESPLKRVKTETESDNNANQNLDGNARENGNASYERNDSDQACHHHHQYSDSMKDTIEHGQYGYLTESGFHRFSLEELKKFAVQVVALFKLDESQQNSRSLPIPVIQNNVTASSLELQGVQSVAVSTEGMGTGNARDDPNKSCYKCGELGHFAWGCTNPRNREIQPKRKRRGKAKKKDN